MTAKRSRGSVYRLAMTKAEHDALELERPFTDYAIGACTDGNRSAQAVASALFTETGITARESIPRAASHPPRPTTLNDDLEEAS